MPRIVKQCLSKPHFPLQTAPMDKPVKKLSREERLAEQLRVNLRRRKAQARAIDNAPEGNEGAEKGHKGADEPA